MVDYIQYVYTSYGKYGTYNTKTQVLIDGRRIIGMYI